MTANNAALGADWKLARAPLPNPGPVRASERQAILRSRRPALAGDQMQRVRVELARKYGAEFWQQKQHRARCRRELAHFVKSLWPVIEPGTELVWNWHLDVICAALERVSRGDLDYRRVLINVPPGHMKSRLVSVFWPAWNWLENPGRRALFVTYVQKLSNRDSIATRDLIRSQEYQALIPHVYGEQWREPWEIKSDEDNIEMYGTTLHGKRIATSVTGAATGFRGDDIVIDDPLNVEEFPTSESLEAVASWYDKRMSTRFNDQAAGAIVIIMQRLHENDLAGHVLAQDALQARNPSWVRYKHICLPSEFDPDSACAFDQRKARGELLFPAKFPRAVIDNAKVQLGAQYSAQHDQRPTSAAGAIFPMASLRFWYPRGHPVPLPHKEKDANGNEVACIQGEIPQRFDQQIQSWDLAFKDEKTSDFVAGYLLARFCSAIYIITEEHGHLGFAATLNAIRVMSTNYPLATAKYIEDKANGPAVIETLHSALFGITPVEPDGGKQARAWATEPAIKAGNVWLPHPALYPWVHGLLGEMRAFPRGRHDDRVDAFTQGVRALMQGGLNTLQAMTRL